MLFSRVTDRFERFEAAKLFVTPSPRQLAGDPGVRCLTDGDRSIVRLIRRNDHHATLGRETVENQTEISEAMEDIKPQIAQTSQIGGGEGFGMDPRTPGPGKVSDRGDRLPFSSNLWNLWLTVFLLLRVWGIKRRRNGSGVV